MKFSYRFYEGKFLPIIPISLTENGKLIQMRAYVDTGASYSLFHAKVAEILGLDVEKGILYELVVGDGDILKAYLHSVTISLAGKEFKVTIGFSKNIGVGFNILGRKDIFDKFNICFNDKDKEISFTPLE